MNLKMLRKIVVLWVLFASYGLNATNVTINWESKLQGAFINPCTNEVIENTYAVWVKHEPHELKNLVHA